MENRNQYLISEVCEELGIKKDFVIHSIRLHWVIPMDPNSVTLDNEDVARLQLILELQRDFGVNDESISIILHLLDQLYTLRAQIKKAA